MICFAYGCRTIENDGEEPVINHVKSSFNKIGYAFEHKVLDTRNYMLPQRRNRCWMWAVGEAGRTVQALASEDCFDFDGLFAMTGISEITPHTLNERQERVVTAAREKFTASDHNKDIVMDAARSESRAPCCIDAVPCIVPNSLPYRVPAGKIFLLPSSCFAYKA